MKRQPADKKKIKGIKEFQKINKKHEGDHTEDISVDLYDMLAAAGLDLNSFKDMVTQKKQVSVKLRDNMVKCNLLRLRQWLKSRNLEKYVDFSDDYREGVKRYYKSLDVEGKGRIPAEKLEDPLITLGITNDFKEVDKIIKNIDTSGNGYVEFEEFLTIMNEKSIKGTGSGGAKINEFFKTMVEGNPTGELGEIVAGLSKGDKTTTDISKVIPFN